MQRHVSCKYFISKRESCEEIYTEKPVGRVSPALFLVLSAGGTFHLKRLLKRRQSMTSSRKTISMRHHDLPYKRGPLAEEGDDDDGEISQNLFFPRTRALPTCFKFTSKCHRVRRGSFVMATKKYARIATECGAIVETFRQFFDCLPPSWFRFRNASELYLSRFSSSLYASGELPVIIGFTIMHCTVRINWCMRRIQIGCTLMGTIKSSYEQVVLPH